MNDFNVEFNVGDIFLRDRWQFELKSEFFQSEKIKKNIYKQEFYFFIPSALQINNETYSKAQFYRDQTNLIRYKTPRFTFQELLDPTNTLSPINKIKSICSATQTPGNIEIIEDELKLLGNVFRSLLREQTRKLLDEISTDNRNVYPHVIALSDEIAKFKTVLPGIEKNISIINGNTLVHSHFNYTNEFISSCICFYLSGLLENIRNNDIPQKSEINQTITLLIQNEEIEMEEDDEYVFYKKGLLNKFILDALLLNTSRLNVYSKYNNIIAAISAGIAMLFFLVLFVWQGNVFIINSLPFIMFTILLYIAKDRIKDGIKNISYRKFHHWFPDYKTEIRSPNNKYVLGVIEESFTFLDESKLPNDIINMRHREFHAVLENFKRPERIIYYKRQINLLHPPRGADSRRNALNTIFRFNISHFVHKADNPIHEYLSVEKETGKLIKRKLPKVYHLNLILKNTYIDENLKQRVEFKKFRLILDKNGIKRSEQITSFQI